MADVSIQIVTDIEGLDELEAAFVEGSPRMVKKFLRKVHSESAAILKDSAEENAPYETGDLSEDIHTQTLTNSDGMTTRVGPSKETYWGLFQEFGAPDANVPAQHWLEMSAREVQDQVLETHIAALDQGLSELKGGK